MRQLPTLDGGRMWVGEAWTEWRHAGVRYWQQLGQVYARDAAGHRYQLVVGAAWPGWVRQPRAEVA